MFLLRRMRSRGAVGLAMVCMLAALPASGQEQAVERKRFGDWMFQCEGDLCQVFHSLVNSETREMELGVSVVVDAATDSATSILNIPVGAALPPGVRLWVDEGHAPVAPFQYCEPDGCRAILPLDAELLAAMLEEGSAVVEYFPYGSQEKIGRRLSFEGLEDALDHLRVTLGNQGD